MWWEDVELWVVSKGRKPYPLPPPTNYGKIVLLPSVNQSLAKKGLIVDQVVWE